MSISAAPARVLGNSLTEIAQRATSFDGTDRTAPSLAMELYDRVFGRPPIHRDGIVWASATMTLTPVGWSPAKRALVGSLVTTAFALAVVAVAIELRKPAPATLPPTQA